MTFNQAIKPVKFRSIALVAADRHLEASDQIAKNEQKILAPSDRMVKSA